MKCQLTSTDPASSVTPVISDCMTLSNDIIEISGNELPNPKDITSRSKSSLTITVNAPNPLDSDGFADVNILASISLKGPKKHYLALETIGGTGDLATHFIPITFSFATRPIAAISLAHYEKLRESTNYELPYQSNENPGTPSVDFRKPPVNLGSEELKEIDFGEVMLDYGTSVTFVVHNPNLFKINFKSGLNSNVSFILFNSIY